jgi:hypothetical protein
MYVVLKYVNLVFFYQDVILDLDTALEKFPFMERKKDI